MNKEKIRSMNNFEKTTTMETLQCEIGSGGSVLRYGTYVMVSRFVFDSYIAEIFEFIEIPEKTDCDWIECQLKLIEHSNEFFEDGGHAIEWALDRIK